MTGTRVPLDTVVYAFNRGATPEEILQQYPALQLVDVHSVIAFYLRNRDDVEDYVEQQKQLAAEVRRENEARFPSVGIRERLLTRRKSG